MQQLDKEQVLEQYKNLPDDLREAIFSQVGDEQIFNIVTTKNLSEDRASLAARLSGRVLLGFLAPRDFISSLAEELQINYETAKQIALEINEQIFLPVRDSLRKIHNLEAKLPSEEKEEEGTPSHPVVVPPLVETIKEEVPIPPEQTQN